MDPKLDTTRLEASVISKNNWAKFGVFPNKNNVGNVARETLPRKPEFSSDWEGKFVRLPS
jgi:hypothetical protein